LESALYLREKVFGFTASNGSNPLLNNVLMICLCHLLSINFLKKLILGSIKKAG
jgi:hypothetical protein